MIARDSPARVGAVAETTRNHVHVSMLDRLARRRARVDANVHADHTRPTTNSARARFDHRSKSDPFVDRELQSLHMRPRKHK